MPPLTIALTPFCAKPFAFLTAYPPSCGLHHHHSIITLHCASTLANCAAVRIWCVCELRCCAWWCTLAWCRRRQRGGSRAEVARNNKAGPRTALSTHNITHASIATLIARERRGDLARRVGIQQHHEAAQTGDGCIAITHVPDQ